MVFYVSVSRICALRRNAASQSERSESFDIHFTYLSRHMRKPAICICENKGADQLCGNREADQRLCKEYSHFDESLILFAKS